MKTNSTLVSDVYEVLQSHRPAEGVDVEQVIKEMQEEMGQIIRDSLTPRDNKRGLRLSAIGKPDRQIYKSVKDDGPGEIFDGNTLLKFTYGHLTEALVLAYVKLAGHGVTDQQKVCHVRGVKGHMDCKINGILVDVKSASSYGFKKFKERRVVSDDPFGYVAQIKAYAHSEGERKFAWLAFDKALGHLSYTEYDMDDTSDPDHKALSWDVEERVEHLKKLVGAEEMPELCYQPVPDGKSGNLKLAMGCSYCSYKHDCWPGLRTFLYSSGPRYLTHVNTTPKVVEEEEGF